MKPINPMLNTDFYKIVHFQQYPAGTTKVYSNWTARKNSHGLPGVDKVVFFGLQYFVKEHLQRQFNEYFFNRPKQEVINEYKSRMDTALPGNNLTYDHIERLHDLGYLPLCIRAVPEGSEVPIGVPMLTIENTHPDFYWLTNYVETLMSNQLWVGCTSATTALYIRRTFEKYARETGANPTLIPFQGHDFSFRGMGGLDAAVMSGAAHLLSFTGTDTIPAINFLEEYYNANPHRELIGTSIPASEHSCMCAGGSSFEDEQSTYLRLIEQVYPNGYVSIVSDTWDYFKVLTELLPSIKSNILNRDGKLVIRGDSGCPIKITCGDPEAPVGSPEYKGTIELLWEVFGGTVNEKGFKELDPHIGYIYGDSITPARQKQILDGLKKKGFASSNVVLGIGSFTYQYATRDNYGFAMKATYCEIGGEGRNIFKAPKTDGGEKKSAKGLLRVNEDWTLSEEVTVEEAKEGLLRPVFLNGTLVEETSLSEIRSRINQAAQT